MRRLYRSSEHKIIGGVCGGLGEHFDIDPTWIRLAFVILAITHGIGLIAYIIGWIVMPRQESVIVVEKSAAEPGEPAEPTSGTTAKLNAPSKAGSLLPGIILICIGALFLINETFWWFSFRQVWPMVLIILGGVLIYRSIESKSETEKEPEVINESR